MTKKDLIKILSKKTGHAQKELSTIVDETFSSILDSVVNGKSVFIAGFGTFKSKERKGRVGTVNFGPHAGETYKTEDSRYAEFSPSISFKESMKE